MPTFKRHVLYLDDETWERIKESATEKGVTASDYVRATLGPLDEMRGRLDSVTTPPAKPDIRSDNPIGSMPQAQRDEILRNLNKG